MYFVEVRAIKKKENDMIKFVSLFSIAFICGCSCSDSGSFQEDDIFDSSFPTLDGDTNSPDGNEAVADASIGPVHEGPGGTGVSDAGPSSECSDAGNEDANVNTDEDGSVDEDSDNDGGDTDGFSRFNNGHGNNCDGVDISNPGLGFGGPNGRYDSSGLFDDECKKFRN
jgi:hypothetical protein